MLAEIKSIAHQITPRLIEIRRHLHTHPELSGQEYQTAAYIAGALNSLGLHVTEEVGKTGVIGELLATKETVGAKCLGIRIDMDALPIEERTKLDFASHQPGVMHACGHDLHTTLGLGTAMILAQLPGSLPGKVKFLFQPAEEIAQGARWMVNDGALTDIDHLLGVHVFPSIMGGSIGIRYGALTAAADDLEIIIQGEAGHGARPHEAIDAIWVATQVVNALQQAISRTQNCLRPVVLTIGKIEGGRAHNIIADRVTMQGTVRSLHPETREMLPEWINSIVNGICVTYGAKAVINYQHGVPAVQNDLHLTQMVEIAAREAWGNEKIQILPEPSLGAEDFAVYLDQVPGSMFRLGVGYPDRHNYPLHHPLFDINEESIVTGVVTMAYSAYKYFHPQ
jgi:amidohydrolase